MINPLRIPSSKINKQSNNLPQNFGKTESLDFIKSPNILPVQWIFQCESTQSKKEVHNMMLGQGTNTSVGTTTPGLTIVQVYFFFPPKLKISLAVFDIEPPEDKRLWWYYRQHLRRRISRNVCTYGRDTEILGGRKTQFKGNQNF